MSAGGLSYSAITNSGRATLPSVESWGTNMNILRDPSSGIFTRRINKVGDTSSITSMIDDSSDRACEAISVYARGVNPFVSVSYSNNGNNGGQRGGGCLAEGGGQSAKLPYTIMRDGAFRPPVLLEQDLLPLSRLPRVWTCAYTQPGFVDFSKKMRTCGTAEQTREVKSEKLKACVRPTATYKMETPLSEPFEVKYVIQPSIKTSVGSGLRTMDITQQNVGKPTKEIDNRPLHALARSNQVDTRNYVNNNDFDSERFIQETNHHAVLSNRVDNRNYVNNSDFDSERFINGTNHHAVLSNMSSNKHHTNIEEILDLGNIPVHSNINSTSAIAPLSGIEQTKYFHEDMELERTLPIYYSSTNLGDKTVYKKIEADNKIELDRNNPLTSFSSNPRSKGNIDNNSKDYKLAPKINPGGFSIPVQIPNKERMQEVHYKEDKEKNRVNRFMVENMEGRFKAPQTFR